MHRFPPSRYFSALPKVFSVTAPAATTEIPPIPFVRHEATQRLFMSSHPLPEEIYNRVRARPKVFWPS
jgi:hypothetical protein